MKRTILAVFLSTMSAAALATGGGPIANAGASAGAAAGASATAIGVSESRATAQGIGLGGHGGSAFAGGGAGYGVGGGVTALGGSIASPSQSITIGGVPAHQTITHNGRSYVENVPNVYAPNIYPTAPCMGSTSAGAGWVGFGFSGGTSWTDTECQLMEAARNAPTAADRVYVWCKSASAKGAPSCAGLQSEPVAAASPAPVERERLSDATVRGSEAADASIWATIRR